VRTLTSETELRTSDAEDPGLIGDFQAGRRHALAIVYRLYWKTLYAAAHDVLSNREDAEDCVHDTLLDVWAWKRRYRPDRGTLRTFLIVCVRNAALTRKRSAARHREIEATICPPQGTDDFADYVAISRLRAALLTLPPDQLRTLNLAFFSRRTHSEIARELDLPLGTVKSRVSLAIKKLYVQLRYELRPEELSSGRPRFGKFFRR
jgi:RNA polymerase sigma-70 factor (ECF subfamily)